MDDVDAGDCSTDGSCAGDDAVMAGPPVAGVKLATTTLTQESVMAFQQFSIGNKNQPPHQCLQS